MGPPRKRETGSGEAIWRRQGLLLIVLAFLIGLHALSRSLLLPDFTDKPDRSRMNPTKGSAVSPGAGTISKVKVPSIRNGKVPPLDPLDINRANREQLMTLPGIGPVLAEHILSYRKEKGRFAEISEIQEVHGIGKKRFEKIKGLIQVEEEGK